MNYKEALQILNVKPDVCLEDAKKAYRTLAKKYHPDVVKQNSGIPDIQINSDARMKEINLAFKSLAPHLKKRAEKPSPDPKTNQKPESKIQKGPAPKKNPEATERTNGFSWADAINHLKRFFDSQTEPAPVCTSFKSKPSCPENKKQACPKNPDFDEILKKIYPAKTGEVKKTVSRTRTARSNPYSRYQKFMALKKKASSMRANRSKDMSIGKIQKISPVKPVTPVK